MNLEGIWGKGQFTQDQICPQLLKNLCICNPVADSNNLAAGTGVYYLYNVLETIRRRARPYNEGQSQDQYHHLS